MANDEDVTGMAFPFRIDPRTGGVAWAVGADKLRQNIRVLIGTRHGERPMLREYGNLSSAFVYFVLDAALSDGAPDGWWWLSSFGAGFSCHGALLKVQR